MGLVFGILGVVNCYNIGWGMLWVDLVLGGLGCLALGVLFG